MLKVYAIDGIVPVVHPDAYVHPSAQLIGDVIVGAGVYVGPCACLRGDFGRIVIEQGANVQGRQPFPLPVFRYRRYQRRLKALLPSPGISLKKPGPEPCF